MVMLCDSTGQDLVNSFALVTYIPAPLSKFLDDLRRELAPGCVPHAHVTILPPRPIQASKDEAIEAVRARIGDFAPFEIEAGAVEKFDISEVVYLKVARGVSELTGMHRAFNAGPLAYKEPFPYHPHITLAQELPAGQPAAAVEAARRAWDAYTGPRTFAVESLVFVQNTARNLWVDLAYFQLEGAPVRR